MARAKFKCCSNLISLLGRHAARWRTENDLTHVYRVNGDFTQLRGVVPDNPVKERDDPINVTSATGLQRDCTLQSLDSLSQPE
jgi:C-terminal processing protease CtpA/Prc